MNALEEIDIFNLESFMDCYPLNKGLQGTFEILSIRCSTLTPEQEQSSTFSPSEVDKTCAEIPLAKSGQNKMFRFFFGIGLGLVLVHIDTLLSLCGCLVIPETT